MSDITTASEESLLGARMPDLEHWNRRLHQTSRHTLRLTLDKRDFRGLMV